MFLLGLEDGLIKQELQRQVRHQDSPTEACALERELRGEGLASQMPVASLATREPPGRPEVDLEQWKEEVKRELRQELQDQLAALGRTLVAELRQQCAPGPVAPSAGGTETRGADNNYLYAPHPDQHSFPYHWDERGRTIWSVDEWDMYSGGAPHVALPGREGVLGRCPQVQLENRPPFSEQLGNALLTRRDPVQIPAYSEVVRWAQVSGGGLAEGQCGLVEGVEDAGESKVARGLVRCGEAGYYCGSRTYTLYPLHTPFIELPRQQPLATIAGIDHSRMQGSCDMVLQTPSPGEVVIEVCTTQAPAGAGSPLDLPEAKGLTADQQQQFQELIRRWTGVFAAHEDFGKTNAVLHNIPTGEAPPSRKRYRPLPPSLFSELRPLLREMLESRVITEIASPWAAPVVLVRKKDGAWRFCVDYRWLNAVSHRDAYPLPRIEESLTGLKQADWYSTLDLVSGYWQVEVDPADREKTAFATPMGLYQFNQMPFMLINTP
ncbi:hypothetical protein SKAU_G00233610 [Synaphobranchus kaupii]|uniref:ribonuclease H n=1 Tax=Synaphobranchus kaupii TaxID=118154 RepID=A0A9Q1F6C9_SYNKA|nr:hypothetical protein SKAU_G00233610 [Synaphobranchus kaupii]